MLLGGISFTAIARFPIGFFLRNQGRCTLLFWYFMLKYSTTINKHEDKNVAKSVVKSQTLGHDKTH
jgi:hypothetical protein